MQMENHSEIFNEIDKIVHPKSIALVGVSSKGRLYWLKSITESGFEGSIYPINPKVESALGLKFYKSLLDIPGDVDLVIVSVPAAVVPSVVKESVMKNAKGVVVFSSGFSENNDEGAELEKKLAQAIKGTKTRLIGPNCMGIYCPQSKVSFRPDSSMDPGPVGFISQSGGHAISFAIVGSSIGLRYSKVFSYGNACDLDSPDFLEYLAEDEKTKVIGMYIEGIKNGARLVKALKKAAEIKPVVVWKGGRSEAGARAAASHTGSLAGSAKIWDTVFKQTGVVQVKDFDELLDTISTFVFCPPTTSENLGLVSISGGSSVSNTDFCVEEGFNVPELSSETKERLRDYVQKMGTSIKNPLDLAGSYNYPGVLENVLEILGEEKKIGSVMFEVQVHYTSFIEKLVEAPIGKIIYGGMLEGCKKIRDKSKKPVLIILPRTSYEEALKEVRDLFINASFPVFPSITSASKALHKVIEYYKRKRE
ncbi:MAG: CoA-binding protein [Candidatus Lokiarchaeia archaeon]